MLRRLLKLAKWTLALAVLGVIAVVGLNAIDADLTPEARALIDPVPPSPATDTNGFLAFLGFAAPEGEDPHAAGIRILGALRAQDAPGFVRDAAWEAVAQPKRADFAKPLLWCEPAKAPCLPSFDKHAGLARETWPWRERYDAIRAKPEFVELYVPVRFDAVLPAYMPLTRGQQLVFLDIATRAAAGNVDGSLEELERSVAFNRRMLAGARTLIGKMVAVTLASRDALLLSELIAAHRDALEPHRDRVATMLRALDARESALDDVFRGEYRFHAAAHRAIVRGGVAEMGAVGRFAPFLYRPNETNNALAQRLEADLALAATPAPDFARAAAAASEQRQKGDADWASPVNPVGKWMLSNGLETGSYAARLLDLGALLTLVRLQHALQAGGATTAEAVTAALAGETGKAHPDPYTGKPMAFDAKSGTIGFVPVGKAGWTQDFAKRANGRVAIPVVR